MINENLIKTDQTGATVTLTNPGLIDPGIIVIGNVEIDAQGWAADALNDVPKIEINDYFIQYKVESNKFLGYIGDLVEYDFKHIPEKYYYNNIYPLELLNTEDQDFLGSEQEVLNKITEHSIFSELVGSDYKSSSSLSPSNYDKFKPKYFGTVTSGDRTIVVFMVPPGYNTAFISNGSGVYSKDDYFKYYGVQLKNNYFQEQYAEMANTPIGRLALSPSYVGGSSSDISATFNPGGLESHVIDSSQTGIVEVYVDNFVDTTTDPDPDPEPNTGGRGRGNGGGTTTVASIADGFSLVTNLDLGLDLVIPNNDLYTTEYMEMGDDTNMILYDYWSPWSNFNFKRLTDYKLYFKRKVTSNSIAYRYFSLDSLLSGGTITNPSQTLINFIQTKFKPKRINPTTGEEEDDPNNYLEASPVISASEGSKIVYRIPVYINIGGSYKNLRGVTKYTYETASINQYRIYKKATSYPDPSKNDDIRNVQCIEFIWDTSKQAGQEFSGFRGIVDSQNNNTRYYCIPTYGPDRYSLEVTESGDPVMQLGNGTWHFRIQGQTLDEVEVVVNGDNVTLTLSDEGITGTSGIAIGAVIKLGNKKYTVRETDWLIKENKQTQETNPYTPRDKSHIDDSPKVNYVDNTNWNNLYGEANYLEYLRNVCQLEINLRKDTLDLYDDYYKLVKIIFSSNEVQNYKLEELDSDEGVLLALEPGDIFSVGEDILRIDYVWKKIQYPMINTPIVDHIPLSTEDTKYFIGARVRVGSSDYILEEYVVTKVNVNSEGIYSAIPGNIISVKVNTQHKTYILVAETSPLAVESVNVVNLGYQTSENPLRNLDKYLVRDVNFVQKYTTTNLGVVDLTSGTYLSPSIREREDETYVSFVRYSYRKTYKKGQTVLMGLPDNLNREIIDIQAMVPNTEKITLDDYSIGSIIYDYSQGKIYRLESEINEIENDPSYSSVTYGEDNCNITLTEPYDSNYLFRYRNEFYMLQKDSDGYSELIRVGKLGIRTWTSLCDNNKGYLPGTSKNWMSRDGDLTVGDKIWLMVTSGNTQRRILGTIAKKSSAETQNIGTCIKLACGILGSKVRVNGTEVLVDNHSNMTQEYNGVERYVYDIYMTRKKLVDGDIKEIYADITNNLVFRDKINYLSNNYES